MRIRVALVDDQELVRTGLAMVVDEAEDMTVVAEAGDGRQAVAALSRVVADVVLMDIRMPGMDGIEATRRLVAGPASPKIIALTTFDLDEYAYAALRAGASGFLLKDATARSVLTAVRTVHAGDAVIAPSTTRRMLDHLVRARSDEPDEDAVAVLTGRERQVLLEIAQGYPNAQIAARLYLSEATVKTHIGRILAKLNLPDRVQIVIFAYDHGLVRPNRNQATS
ncbi:MAG: response regulator transcription factor [Dactylosporangium sp.]|nr:response regulator transcription factor [Dactylosporangium sp.]NNJ61243.1 response regulator transcription factor [Dactylosporangium sp.]